MTIPKDPVMLLSYLDTQLRDFYASLTELCDDLELEEDEIKNKLAAIGYHYDADQNQFI